MKDVFALLGLAFSLSHRFLAVRLCNRLAYGTHDLFLSSDFYSCGRCSHCPLAVCPNFSPVGDLKSCLVVGHLHVRFDADLILPFLTVSLVKTQVLPIDGANCKVSFWGPGPASKWF